MEAKQDAIIQIRTTRRDKEDLIRGATLAGGDRASLSGWLVGLGLAASAKAEQCNEALEKRFGVKSPLSAPNRLDEFVEAAVSQQASDVCFRMTASGAAVSFCVDSVWSSAGNISKAECVRISEALRAALDLTSEQFFDEPQVRSWSLLLQSLSARISFVKTLDGAVIVMRFIGRDQLLQIPADRFNDVLPYVGPGSFTIVFGAVRSGKTIYAYNLLCRLCPGDRAYAVEETVEYYEPSITQVQKRPGAIRALARTNPSVVYVGELRSADDVREAQLLSAAGVAVIVDMHAAGPEGVLLRLKSLVFDFGLNPDLQMVNVYRNSGADGKQVWGNKLTLVRDATVVLPSGMS